MSLSQRQHITMEMLHTVDRDFWWEVARNCEYATFFHTPLWQEIALRNRAEFRDATVGFVLPRGVRAVFPLLSTRRFGPLQSLISTFEFCYGGIIADGPVTPDELREMYQRTCSWNVTGLRFLENPIAERVSLTTQFFGSEYSTHIVNLDGDFDAVFGRFVKNQRNSYRKGIKMGVEVGLAETLDDYRDYYRAYEDTIRRWGEDPATYGYRWSLFETIFDLSRIYPELIKLWVARVDGKVIGGRLRFYWQHHVAGWQGCAHSDYLAYKPYVVLDTEVMRDAISRGYAYYDLNPTGDLSSGISDYKASIGTSIYPITNWQYENPSLQQGVHAVRSFRERINSIRQKAV